MKPELVTAISSVVIAGAALFVAVWHAFATREHNRLSVRPFFRIDRNQSFGRPIEIILQNTGVGPGFIDRLEIRVDDTAIEGDRFARLRTAMDRIGLADRQVEFFTPLQGEAIAAGESHTLLEVFPHEDTAEARAAIIAVLPRLTYSIAYHSIYDEPFVVTL
jgi:hypothetical protein